MKSLVTAGILILMLTSVRSSAIAPCGPLFAVPREVMDTAAGVVGDRPIKIVPHQKENTSGEEAPAPISFDDLAIPGHSTDLDPSLISSKLLNLFYHGHQGQSPEEDAKMRLDIMYVVGFVSHAYHTSNGLSMLDSTTSRDFDVVGDIEKDSRVTGLDPNVTPPRFLEGRLWRSLPDDQRQTVREVAAGGYRPEEAIQERRELSKVINQSTCLSSGVVQALANMKPEMHGEDEIFRKPLFTDAELKRVTEMQGEHGEYIMRVDEHWKGSKLRSLRAYFSRLFSRKKSNKDASSMASDRAE